MQVTGVSCHVLLDPEFDREATDSARDTLVVEVHTDAGLTGIGETDLNAWIARACIIAPGTHTMDRGLGSSLIGRDPLDPVAVWEALYRETAMTGRRGALIHALGALDIALWDVCGQARDAPCWRLLGGHAPDRARPYASLLPHAATIDDLGAACVAQAVAAQGLGFGAAKLELLLTGPYADRGQGGGGLAPSQADDTIVAICTAVRAAVGDEFALMLDVAYGWDTVDRAAGVLERLAPLGLDFVETPLWPDDLDAYADLGARSPIPIAAGEWLATRHEFLELVQRGHVRVLQPDVGRVGGLSEAARVCGIAQERGLTVVPHGWKTGITLAATLQLAAAFSAVSTLEFLPRELAGSALRRDLVRDEVALDQGRLSVPTRAGLGVELDRTALRRFAQAADRVAT